MSIINELLILLDDSPGITKNKLAILFSDISKQKVYSSLGRLIKKGLIKEEKIDGKKILSNSESGKKLLDSELDFLKRQTEGFWQENWKLVFFNIEEKERGKRDIWRRYLKSNGFGFLREGVWIMPLDCEESLKKISKELKINEKIFILSTDLGQHSELKKMIEKSWDWNLIKESYQQYIKEADSEFNKLKKETNRLTAKKLVYRYSQILKSEPVLPIEFSPIAALSSQAYELYQKIRPYCYK